VTLLENTNRYVVDAAIVVKWILPESRYDRARTVARSGNSVLAPDVILSQIGMNLRTRVRLGELSEEEAHDILRVVGLMPLQLHRTWSLAPEALEIERRIRCPMPACIHLALALREDAVYITGSRDLYNSVQDSTLGEHIEWLGNLVAC